MKRQSRGGDSKPALGDHPGRTMPRPNKPRPSKTPPLPPRTALPPQMATPTSSAVIIDRYWIPAEEEDGREKIATSSKPTVHERREAVSRSKERLEKMLAMGNAAANYREGSKPIWAAVPKNHLTECCLKVVHEVPAAWPLALEFLCQLAHESVHFTLLNRESRTKNDMSNVDEALHTIVKDIRAIVDGRRCITRCLELLGILCNFFAELCRLNHRRPTLQQMYVEGIMDALKAVPTVKLVLDLLDHVLTYLLEEQAEACTQTLIAASTHGFHFEWVWFHVVLTFPSSIVQHLLWQGMKDFRSYIETVTQCGQMQNASIFAKQHEEYLTKFTAIKDVLVFLAKKLSAELKSCALKMIKQNLEDQISEKVPEDLSVLFMIRLIAYSRDILDFLINDIVKLVNYRNALNATRMVLQIDRKFVLLPNQTYGQFFGLVVQALSNTELSKLIVKLTPIAYGEHADNLGGNMNTIVSDGAGEILDEIANAALAKVHMDTGSRVIVDCNVLRRYADDGNFLQKAIEMMFTKEKSRVFHMKVLHALCLDNTNSIPVNMTSEVIMRCLCTAKDHQELTILVSFLETVVPFNVDCLKKAIATKGGRRERKSLMSDAPDFTQKDALWIRNLKTLMEWERGAADDQVLKYIGAVMLENMGQIIGDIFSWTLDELSEAYERREDPKTVEEVISTVRLVTSFISTANHAAYLRNKDTYQIIAKTAGILALILRFIEMDRSELIDAYQSFLECVVKFFLPLPARMDQRTQLIIHLLSEVFEMSAELFGSCRDMGAWDEEIYYAAGCEAIDFDVFGLFDKSDKGDDILKQLESLTTESDRASKVAHSGKLVRKGNAPKNQRFAPNSNEVLRRLILLNTLKTVCTTPDRILFQRLLRHREHSIFCGFGEPLSA
uniref:HECT domain-containing protein n=1 Tax=Steinernema glaseri TaxID=37863 RepID=A0A1I7YGW3_9BILA